MPAVNSSAPSKAARVKQAEFDLYAVRVQLEAKQDAPAVTRVKQTEGFHVCAYIKFGNFSPGIKGLATLKFASVRSMDDSAEIEPVFQRGTYFIAFDRIHVKLGPNKQQDSFPVRVTATIGGRTQIRDTSIVIYR